MSTEQPVRYWVEFGGRSFPAREVHGREVVSAPFRLEARFFVEIDSLPGARGFDPEAHVKTPAAVILERAGQIVRRIDGLATEVSITATARGAPEIALVIEPRLALGRHRSDVRLFRDRTAPEIVAEVLAGFGVTAQERLQGRYEKRAYCVQMRETDLDFVHRLLEDEGIFYYFLEGDVLVLGDGSAAYDAIAGDGRGSGVVPFRPAVGMDRSEESVHVIGRRASLTASKVTLRDWNPDHPSLDMDVSATVPSPIAREFYDYPGEYALPAQGAAKARLMADAFACAAGALAGQSACPRFGPGLRFELVDAPPGIDDGAYVITAVAHAWRRDDHGFANEFEALEASVVYRPARVTPCPTLSNPVTGFVTGPPGEDVHTDAFGRVKVHFPWDRTSPRDDTCSDWVPVLQDNTGHSSAIPRVGWEVVVHFLEGDPDRPVVLGRVYNAVDRFPEPLPEGKTRTSLKSLSSPGRDGTNMIRFDDQAGKEQVYVHAERDQRVVVAHDKREEVQSDESSIVYRDETIAIGNEHTETVGKDMSVVVGGDQTWSVAAGRKRKVEGDSQSQIQGDHTLTVAGSQTSKISMLDGVSVKELAEQIGVVVVEASVDSNSTTSEQAMTLTVGGAIVEVAQKTKTETVGKARTETIGGVVFSKSGAEMVTSSKTKRYTTVGGALTVKAAKALTLTGTQKLAAKSLLGDITGPKSVTLKVGESTVVLKDGVVHVVAKEEIRLKATGNNAIASSESKQN